MDGDSYADLSRLVDLLVEDRDVAEFLDELAQVSAQCASAYRDVLCGIIQNRNKRNTVMASSSKMATAMDEIQAGFDEGPCLESHRSGVVIRVSDVKYEKRWPDYMAAVRESGINSILSIPLRVDGPARAAMNFYSYEVGTFDDTTVDMAQRYAGLASRVLGIALRIAAYSDAAEDRRAAMESRTSIDVAVGVIMGQSRCSQEEAFAILQRASSQRNIKLRVMAEELVAGIGHGTPSTFFDP